jgi:hypothetical protein
MYCNNRWYGEVKNPSACSVPSPSKFVRFICEVSMYLVAAAAFIYISFFLPYTIHSHTQREHILCYVGDEQRTNSNINRIIWQPARERERGKNEKWERERETRKRKCSQALIFHSIHNIYLHLYSHFPWNKIFSFSASLPVRFVRFIRIESRKRVWVWTEKK